MAAARERLEAARAAEQEFRSARNIIDSDPDKNLMTERLVELARQRSLLDNALAEAEAAQQQVEAARARAGADADAAVVALQRIDAVNRHPQVVQQQQLQLDAARRAETLRAALMAKRSLPPIILVMAEAEFGAEALAALLAQAEGGLLPQAEGWLALNGTLDDWLAVRRRLPRQRPPAGWLLSDALGDPATSVPNAPGPRLEAARALGRQRLPLPPPLRALLDADGPPGSLEAARWPAPGGPVTADWLRSLAATAPAYRGLLHVPAGRQAYEEAQLAAAVLEGRSEGVRRDTWPPLTGLALATARSADERSRLGGIQSVQLAQGWEPLPDNQGSACWWMAEADQPLRCSSQRWVGVALDGRWIGWRRGDFPVAADAPGLHRVQLLTP